MACIITYKGKQYPEDQFKEILLSEGVNDPQIRSALGYKTPDTPFSSTSQWVNLALRRMIRYGSENGFDRIAFISGQQAADLYDLSKQLDRVVYTDDKQLLAYKGGNQVLSEQLGNDEQLEDYVGKEVAKNLLESERIDADDQRIAVHSPKVRELSGLDLQVGGEGMKSFYDKIIPSTSSKLLKKLDKTAQVERIQFGDFEAWFKQNRAKDDPTWEEYQQLTDKEKQEYVDAFKDDQRGNKKLSDQFSFPITPVIRQTAIKEGMPLFQRVDTVQEPKELTFSKWDKRRAMWQDRMIYLKKMQDLKYSDKEIDDALNVYDKENLSKGIILEKDRVFKKDLWKPMEQTLKTISKEGLSYDQASRYLKAKHIVLDNIEKGGIPMDEAKQIVKEFESKSKNADKLMDHINKINQYILDTQLEAGLLSKEKHKDLQNFYKFYVPLRGFNEADVDPTIFTRDYKRKGRASESGDPIAYLGAMAQTAITKGEQNKVLKSLYDFIVENPDSKLYTIKTAYYIKDKDTGKLLDVVHTRPSKDDFEKYDISMTDPTIDDEKAYDLYDQKTAFERENINVKINGRSVTIQFKGPEAKTIANAIKGQSLEKFPKTLAMIGDYTRLLRMAYTQYSPEFAIRNLIRDTFTGLINVRTDFGTKASLETFGNMMGKNGSMGTIAQWVRSGEYNTKTKNGRYLQEYVTNGAITGYSDLKTVEDIKKELQKSVDGMKSELNAMQKAGGATKDAINKILNPIDQVNRVFENSTRFAAYITAREKGMSPQQAAMYVKDLTVNFNRKGTVSDLIGNFYLFFNASVQGVERLVRPFHAGTKEQKVRAYTQALFTLPAIHTALMMLNKLWWDQDEDGEYYYDKLPEYIRTHNLTIPNFFSDEPGTFFHIPLPYGFNVLFTWPESVFAMAEGRQKPIETVLKTFALASESFSPLGAPNFENMSLGESALQYTAPTAVKPVIDAIINKNFMGNPIYKEPYPGSTPEPNSQQYFQSVNPIIRSLTDTANAWTGGDEITPGAVDINPEILEHFITSWTGGVGKFIANTAATGMNIAEGNNPLSYDKDMVTKTPFARNYTSKVSDYWYQSKFYELIGEVESKKDIFDRYKKSNRDSAKNFRELNENYLKMYAVSQNYKEKIQDLRSRVNTMEALGRMEEAKKAEAQMDSVFKKYIKIHNDKLENKTVNWRDLLGL